MTESKQEPCEVRVWCPECQRSDYTTSGDKYLCAACGKTVESAHEVHHEIFPHIAGDKEGVP